MLASSDLGTTTYRPIRRRSARRPPKGRRGSLYLQTTNGSRASLWRPPSSRPWRSSTSNTPMSQPRRRRNSPPRARNSKPRNRGHSRDRGRPRPQRAERQRSATESVPSRRALRPAHPVRARTPAVPGEVRGLNRTAFVLDSTKREHRMNFSATGQEGPMREWLMDAAAGFGLVVFIGSAFLLTEIAPAVLHTF